MKERQDMCLLGGGEPSIEADALATGLDGSIRSEGGEPSMEADALVSPPAVGPEMLTTVPSPSGAAKLGVVVRFMGGAYG